MSWKLERSLIKRAALSEQRDLRIITFLQSVAVRDFFVKDAGFLIVGKGKRGLAVLRRTKSESGGKLEGVVSKQAPLWNVQALSNGHPGSKKDSHR